MGFYLLGAAGTCRTRYSTSFLNARYSSDLSGRKVGPRSTTILEVGDRLMVLGDEEDLQALRPTLTAAPKETTTA